MMLQYFQMLESRLNAKIQKTPDKPNARRKFALEIAKLGTRLYSGEHRVAWCGVVAPFDMLSAMNVTSCFVEFVGAMLSSTGNVGMFLEESEHAGFAAETREVEKYARAKLARKNLDLIAANEVGGETGLEGDGGFHPFKGRQALLQHIIGRIHQSRVNVPEFFESKQICGMLRALENITAGCVDRHCPGSSRRIRFLPRVQGQRSQSGFPWFFAHLLT